MLWNVFASVVETVHRVAATACSATILSIVAAS
jgi:hypothetical protein